MTMHVTEQNTQAAESVLFIHGGNVAGWMWEAQVDALPDFHTIVPDLPGFGASNGERWESLADTADQLAAIIRERANGGTAHVVGLSLGALVGTVLVARHPELVRSAMLTGAPLGGVHGFANWAGMFQLRMWGSRGYWKTLAKAYRMPDDVLDIFIETGLGIDRPSARRMMAETYSGVTEQLSGLVGSTVPLLVLAGEKDDPSVARSFPDFTSRSTAATTHIVPKMHHAWNAEDPELFNRIMREWLTRRTASAELLAG
ncbi:alpha/beta fold hydrolase [Salinibacterium sp. ZJ450]|uniref:alpha/beta fold hydrolase n=1 Tax=Salinibacterium sp. ZJ450 TaxID=2708338 RepID=UPI00141FF071|nr:alpha/beta hydrolase [Salinibacterium sp. ZJ450]